jgi:hypothetical protein
MWRVTDDLCFSNAKRCRALIASCRAAGSRAVDVRGRTRLGSERSANVSRSRRCGSTLRSIGHIARIQRILDNDAEHVDPLDMLAELRDDNAALTGRLREVHEVVDELRDIATASLIENWIDKTERRAWFLFESSRGTQ